VAACARAVDSVLAQTQVARTWNCIVVDDGSTDGTRSRAGNLWRTPCACCPKPNRGPAAARNTGLECRAQAIYVAFLDADDWWEADKLAAQVTLLDSHPELGFCSTATRLVDSIGMPLGDWPCQAPSSQLPDALFMNGALISGSTSGVLARRALVQQAGGFDVALRGYEDPDLWIRLSAIAGYACIPRALTVVVRTPGSVSSHLPNMRKATLASFRKNRHLLPAGKQGRFWRAACAGALTDYAKTAWRAGARRHAWVWTVEALVRSPLGRGRLALGLLLAMYRGERL
jgi:glycosyltransferase involved in cell wall biosynthesis